MKVRISVLFLFISVFVFAQNKDLLYREGTSTGVVNEIGLKVPWTGVQSRPTALSHFTNDLNLGKDTLAFENILEISKPNSNISTQNGFYKTTSGVTLQSSKNTISVSYSNFIEGFTHTRPFKNGFLRVRVKGGSAAMLRLDESETKGSTFSVWTLNNNVHYGKITNAGIVTQYGVVASSFVGANDFYIELKYDGNASGKVVEIRTYNVTSNRPSSPTATYTFTGIEGLTTGGKITFASLPGTCTYQSIAFSDNNTRLRNLAKVTGYWYDDITPSGKMCLNTINQGANIETVINKGKYLRIKYYVPTTSIETPIISVFLNKQRAQRFGTVGGENEILIPLEEGIQNEIRITAKGLYEHNSKWYLGEGIAIVDIETDGIFTKPQSNKRTGFFGDSITDGSVGEGVPSLPTNGLGDYSTAQIYGRLNNIDVYQHGFGGSGITVGGAGGVAKGIENISYFMDKKPVYGIRLDEAFINYGTNDQAANSTDFISQYNSFLQKFDSIYGIKPTLIIPPLGFHKADIIAIANSNSLRYIDLTLISPSTTDGTHPDESGHYTIAEYITKQNSGVSSELFQKKEDQRLSTNDSPTFFQQTIGNNAALSDTSLIVRGFSDIHPLIHAGDGAGLGLNIFRTATNRLKVMASNEGSQTALFSNNWEFENPLIGASATLPNHFLLKRQADSAFITKNNNGAVFNSNNGLTKPNVQILGFSSTYPLLDLGDGSLVMTRFFRDAGNNQMRMYTSNFAGLPFNFEGNYAFLNNLTIPDATASTHAVNRQTADSRYLGISATAENAMLLNSQNSAYYQNSSNQNAGTLADTRLSNNVALKNSDNIFAGAITIGANSGFSSNPRLKVLGFSDTQGLLELGDGGVVATKILRTSTNKMKMITSNNNGTFDFEGSYKFILPLEIANPTSSTHAVTLAHYQNASNLSTGTISDARLSSNIPLKNGSNTFSGTNYLPTNTYIAADPAAFDYAADAIYVEKNDYRVRSASFQSIVNATQANDTFAITAASPVFNISSNLVTTVDIGIYTAASIGNVEIRLPSTTAYEDNQIISITTDRKMQMAQGNSLRIANSSGTVLIEIFNDFLDLITHPYEFKGGDVSIGVINLQIQYSKKRNKWRIISFNEYDY